MEAKRIGLPTEGPATHLWSSIRSFALPDAAGSACVPEVTLRVHLFSKSNTSRLQSGRARPQLTSNFASGGRKLIAVRRPGPSNLSVKSALVVSLLSFSPFHSPVCPNREGSRPQTMLAGILRVPAASSLSRGHLGQLSAISCFNTSGFKVQNIAPVRRRALNLPADLLPQKVQLDPHPPASRQILSDIL